MPKDAVPSWCRLEQDAPFEEKRDAVRSFLERPEVDLPLVLKPDSGERGFEVEVTRTPEAVAAYLRRSPRRLLVQEWIGGEEFGVFYVRRPGTERGRVTSVTRKVPPTVIGDGHSTLDHLILSNERAVCYVHAFLARHADRAQTVPEDGEVVPLGDLGTHARGAQFLDGNDLSTPDLEETIERIARSVDGFYFGRFDLRAPSAAHLARGEGIRVLELNGVTSEEAHIYDPRHNVFYAWRTLMSQWSTAFAIGSANRHRGLRPAGTRAVLGELWRYRQRTRQSSP